MAGSSRRAAALVAAFALGASLLASVPAAAQSAYDDGWYRATFWSGEYPNGFTMTKAETTQLRAEPAAQSKPSIDCPLPEKATFHPWNAARVLSDGLAFVAYTETDPMVVRKAFETTLIADADSTETQVSFKPGDTWTYLAYFGEGAFLMEYQGVRYSGDQGLAEVSDSTRPGTRGYEEWMRINCSNHNWGWLFMGDVAGKPAFGPPNITEYGTAADAE